MRYWIVLFLFCLGIGPAVQAQNKGVVKGRVFDLASNEAIPFANVVVYGTTLGGATDEEGRFRLENVPPGLVRLEVMAGCIGPFSLAGRLYDMSEIMVAIYTDPEVILQLLDKCTAFILKYCAELKRLGASGVFIAEPAAGLLSNEDCMAYSTVFIRQIVQTLQDDDFAVILHNCGNTGQCTQAMVESGAAALHFGNAIDMVSALQECPSSLLVMGNIDPVGIMKQASPEVVRKETLALLEATASCRNFVLSTGCDVPPQVSQENIAAFFQALDEFNSL